jgi:REP element-mobilizing transposase RayT
VRQTRIKIPAAEAEAVYHCMSRTVNGERLWDDVAKEVLRDQLWRVADYCGVQVVTYTILSNHFHVLVRVPQRQEVSDNELLRRFKVLYPKPTKYQAARFEVVVAELASNGPEAIAWRQRQLALMGDVSPFMKLLKQRFSIWFNKTHDRFGTLWAERFKSVLIEASSDVVRTIAAYVDLNSVRAGLATDPKDYRFCSYAEAVAGNKVAQAGILSVVGDRGWSEAQAQYREILFGTGAGAREGSATMPVKELEQVLAEGGRLLLATVLRCRIRYFTDGAILGSTAFVQLQLVKYRERTGRRKGLQPQTLPSWTNWGDLAALRRLRKPAIG